GLRGALEGALGRDQRRALLPLAARDVVAAHAGLEEQPVGRLVEPFEIGRVVNDARGIAVAPLDHDLVPATQRHGAAHRATRRRSPPASLTGPRLPDRPVLRPAHWPR